MSSRLYTVVVGDDFELISKKTTGIAEHAAAIKQANPQTSGGLSPGMVLTLPQRPQAVASDATEALARLGEDVAVSVNGELFRFWSTFKLRTAIDGFSRFSFGSAHEPFNADFKRVFKPLAFQELDFHVGGERVFSGHMIGIAPSTTQAGRIVSVEGYPRCGVLNDCTLGASVFAAFEKGEGVEWDHFTLPDIAKVMAKPFGLTPIFEAAPEIPLDEEGDQREDFERVATPPTMKIWPFWAGLARQRNLVIGNNADGNPVFRRTNPTPATQTLREGSSPVLSVEPEFRPQQFYSSITGLSPAFWGEPGAQYTVANPHLVGVHRPFTFTVDDALDAAGAKSVVDSKVARMFADALAYRVELVGARDVEGKLWQANTRVRLFAPGAMVYEETEFLIRAVELEGDAVTQRSALTLVLPEAFDGQIPERLPWN